MVTSKSSCRFLIFSLLMFSSIRAQMSGELKNFLWEKDFNTLIDQYQEQKIVLFDKGDYQKRIEQRSFLEQPGMRIQTFAGSSLENARVLATNLQDLQLDSVYVVSENGLFKVQLGNFTERLEAEKMLDRLRFSGISNAWIIQTNIHVSKKSVTLTEETASASQPETVFPDFYAIQILVSSHRGKASRFADQFSDDFQVPARVIQSGENWKVVVGRFREEAEARDFLEQIRSAGYSDAWVTQIGQ